MKKIVLGFLMGAIITASLPSMAKQSAEMIQVLYDNIKIFKNGRPIEPKDVNGKIVEPFTYNGTTYLPLRSVCDIIGKQVAWDEESKSVLVTDKDFVRYFPNNQFYNQVDKDNETASFYADQLLLLQEPALCEDAFFNTWVLRFTCIPSFQDTYSIRIMIDTSTYQGKLYYKKINNFNELTEERVTVLTKEQTDQLFLFLDTVEFTEIPSVDEEWQGLDGSNWLVEMSGSNFYHAVDRWSPREGSIFELGKLLCELADVEFTK